VDEPLSRRLKVRLAGAHAYVECVFTCDFITQNSFE